MYTKIFRWPKKLIFALAFVLFALALLSFSQPPSRAYSCASYNDPTTATWVSQTDLCYRTSDYQQSGSSGDPFLVFSNISFQISGQPTAPCNDDQIYFTSDLSQKTAHYETDTTSGIGANGSYTCGKTRYVNIKVTGTLPTKLTQQATWVSYDQISYAGKTYTEFPYPYILSDAVHGLNAEYLMFYDNNNDLASPITSEPGDVCPADGNYAGINALGLPSGPISSPVNAEFMGPVNPSPGAPPGCTWTTSPSPVQVTGTRPQNPGAKWIDQKDLSFQLSGSGGAGLSGTYSYEGDNFTDSAGITYYEYVLPSSAACVSDLNPAILLSSENSSSGILTENVCQNDLTADVMVIDIQNVQPGSSCGTTSDGSQEVTDDSGKCVAVSSACAIPNNGGPGVIQTDGSCAAPQLNCPITGPAGWFLCPIFNLAQSALLALSNQISNFMFVHTNGIFTGTTNVQFNNAFNNFRDIGLTLLVIASLVMVVSQAAGLEIFAAYTVRKALPRIVIAIIGIAVAWSLLQFLIVFFNDIGTWAYSLITSVTSVSSAGSTYNAGNVISPRASTIAGVGFATAIGALGMAGLFSLVLTAMLALLVGFIILSLRWLIIVICILTAPLAIAAYVLPGTNKLWLTWKNSLLSALMMYPLIMAFLATGQALSSIAMPYNPVLGIIVFFAPFFMLPFAFKMMPGLMGTVSGAVSNSKLAKGGFGALSAYRKNEVAWRHQQTMEGKNSFGSSRLGGLYRRAATRGGLSVTGSGRARYAAFEQNRLSTVANKAVEEGAGIAGDDTATKLGWQRGMTREGFITQYRAGRKGSTRGQAVAALGALEAGFGARLGSSAMQVASYKAWAKSPAICKVDPSDPDSDIKQFATAAGTMVSSGLMTSTDAIMAIKANPARPEISGAGFEVYQPLVDGAATQIKAGKAVTVDAATATKFRESVVENLQPRSLVNARPEAIAPIARQIKKNVLAAYAHGDPREIYHQLGFAAGVQDYLADQAPQNANGFAQELMQSDVPLMVGGIQTAKMVPLAEAIHEARDNPILQEVRSATGRHP